MPWTSSSIALISAVALLLGPAAARAQTPPLPPEQVAQVAGQPISKAEFDHWHAIARASERQDPAGPTLEGSGTREGMVVILTGFYWLEHEAAQRGIAATTVQVNREFRKQKRESFRTENAFQRYLRTSGMTVADVKRRVRLGLLSGRLTRQVVAGAKTLDGQQRRLQRFAEDFAARWRAQTVCAAGYESEFACGSIAPASA